MHSTRHSLPMRSPLSLPRLLLTWSLLYNSLSFCTLPLVFTQEIHQQPAPACLATKQQYSSDSHKPSPDPFFHFHKHQELGLKQNTSLQSNFLSHLLTHSFYNRLIFIPKVFNLSVDHRYFFLYNCALQSMQVFRICLKTL